MTTLITTGEEAIEIAAKLAPAFAAGASARDRDRVLPHAEVDALSESGLLAITVPVEFGGPGLDVHTLTRVLAIIAAADPSIAQIPQSHFVFLDALRRKGSRELKEHVYGQVLDGARIANAQTERHSRTVAEDDTVLTATDGRLRIDGVKYYSTGSLFADILAVRTVDTRSTTPRSVVAFIPVQAPGITVADDWDGLGQRTTASGTVVLDGVAVDEAQLLDYTALFGRTGTFGARAQLLHAAIDTGIARGALDAGADVATAARPWAEADVARAVDDPLLIAQAGELELAVRTAESLVATAAQTITAAEARKASGPTTIAEASLATAAAKVAAGRAARQVATELFDLGGTRSATGAANLSRYWRDARTHTLHDPERWKLHHLGRWALERLAPPSHSAL